MTSPQAAGETSDALRRAFSYGSRSNLDFKFMKDLSDGEFGDFIEELLGAIGTSMNDGEAARILEVAYRWQITAYAGHLGDPAEFPHRHDDVPLAPLTRPLSESRVALIASSGHFVEGDDPRPFGEPNMTQAEAEARIGEFLREAPSLSEIPFDVDPSQLRVRHGGYPVDAVSSDHRVALPLEHLRTLEAEGRIGELVPSAFSFVGAASQLRLQRDVAPAWAEHLRELGTDVALVVPV